MGFFSSLSFLTPLYFAAGLAVGLPVLLHLIRRTPKGRQDFSSVMFLTPSPPRITRRSRIENWLLLLLRGLAVLLIVAAFTRPLWRELQAGLDDSQAREAVIVLDVSASLQREGLWEEALAAARSILATLTPTDGLTLLSFDDRVHVLLDRREWSELDPAQRQAVATDRLNALQPGWGPSYLDRALIAAADRLEQAEAGSGDPRTRTIVVISDLQAGSRWEGLQEYQWPRGVTVELVGVGADASPNNAGVQLVGPPQMADPPFVRVRVTNAANSQQEQFHLGWRGEFDDPQTTGPTAGTMPVYVPPGQSRVVRLPHAEGEFASVRVALAGDDHAFDNQAAVSWPERQQTPIVYLGPDAATERDGLRYFLEPLFADTEARDVSILDAWPEAAVGVASGASTEATQQQTSPALVIANGPIESATLAPLRGWIEAGGVALYVCTAGDTGASLFALAEQAVQPVVEAEVGDYVMLREVDFGHPLFRALDDPRFSDLSKVHIWKHRRVDAAGLGGARVLARFDDGDPALLESTIGRGRLLVLTAGWNRSDSELATWSKFIPIMNALHELARPTDGAVSQIVVGESASLGTLSERTPPPRAVSLPDGTEQPWGEFAANPVVRMPGLYRVLAEEPGSEPLATFAVSLPADESQTAPLGIDVLDAVGLRRSGEGETPAEDGPREEQLARGELESRQKLWRWLLGAALVALLAETVLAGRRSTASESLPLAEAG